MELKQLWTVGHSNRELSDFLQMLKSEAIEALADVRRFPGSRKWPHFGRDSLAAALQDKGLEYRHFPELGGRRNKQREDSPNTAWRVTAFRNYADYMLTAEFAESFRQLSDLAASKRTAIMCSEALPWRCHRRLIADQFVALGWRVFDIMTPGKAPEHALPPFANVTGGVVTYPGEAGLFG
jgi:uncharacterized protein (DUF488 family)